MKLFSHTNMRRKNMCDASQHENLPMALAAVGYNVKRVQNVCLVTFNPFFARINFWSRSHVKLFFHNLSRMFYEKRQHELNISKVLSIESFCEESFSLHYYNIVWRILQNVLELPFFLFINLAKWWQSSFVFSIRFENTKDGKEKKNPHGMYVLHDHEMLCGKLLTCCCIFTISSRLSLKFLSWWCFEEKWQQPRDLKFDENSRKNCHES